MKRSLFNCAVVPLVCFIVFSPPLKAQTYLTFSEVMFYPAETNGEFIELVNNSLTDTINLSGYKIKYYTSSSNNLAAYSGGMKLPPGKFAIILQGSYNFENGVYKNLIPPGTLILKTGGNNFGSSGMANTTDRNISIISPAGDTVDSYSYTANNTAGISDEKIILTAGNSSFNWGNSKNIHGTPGYKNSIAPINYNLSVALLIDQFNEIHAGDTINIIMKIKNCGTLHADSIKLNLYLDENRDSLYSADEIVYYKNISQINAGDSAAHSYTFYVDSVRAFNFMAEIIFAGDEDETNNKAFINFTSLEKPAARNDIVINEIMYAPLNDEPEWIEIYNRSGRSINIKKWKIADSNSSVEITGGDFLINPGEYAVISDEETISNYYNIPGAVIVKSLPNFNNTGDRVVIYNSGGDVIDSLNYSPDWGGQNGKSLERISTELSSADKTNWASSRNILNATPGNKNSVVKLDYDLSVSFFDLPAGNLFKGDTFSINISIKNIGKNTADFFSAEIYLDSNGDSIAGGNEKIYSREFNSLATGDSITCSYEFHVRQNGIHVFMAVVNYPNDENIINNICMADLIVIEKPADVNSIVINEFMYAPQGGEPEWIEFYNRSDTEINLTGWSIGDNTNRVFISNADYSVSPGEYFVISDDSSIQNFYNIKSRLIIKSLPALSNSGDEIILRDNFSRTIDSVKYGGGWGINGKSIEKVEPAESGIDQINWKISATKLKATPGRINSVSKKSLDLCTKNYNLNYEFAEIEKPSEVSIEIENAGTNPAINYSVILFKYMPGSGNPYSQIEVSVGDNLISGAADTIRYVIENLIEGANLFCAVVNLDEDEYRDNDTICFEIKAVKIEVNRNDLVINEVMFKPLFPENEWIEIYNRADRNININGFYVYDKTSNIRMADYDKIIAPGNYLVVSRDSSIFSIYENPGDVIVAPLPQLNDTGDRLVITDSLNRVIDSLEYKNNWCAAGKSLERVDVNIVTVDSSNWRQCALQRGGTPSKINSISPKNINGAVAAFYCVPHEPDYNSPVEFFADVINKGKYDFNYELNLREIFTDGTSKTIELTSGKKLKSGMSETIKFLFKIDSISHAYLFSAEIIVNGDEDLSDNKFELALLPGYPPKSILINEIMFYPAGGEPEWIEIFNNSVYEIDIGNWQISDVLQSPSESILHRHVIKPQSYAIISKDSSILNFHKKIECGIIINGFANLNNDADGVVIKDSRGITIDSVFYKTSFPAGRSIERISVDENSSLEINWRCSNDIELSTPGRINSVTQKKYDLCLSGLCINKTFPVKGDKLKLKTTVKNLGSKPAENFEVEFYLIENGSASIISKELIGVLLPSDSLEITTSKSFPFDVSVKAMAGISFGADEDSSNNRIIFDIICGSSSGDVLINEIMFNPLDGEAEWIEIYNNSGAEINLKNWRVADIMSPSEDYISFSDAILPAGCFAVITPDTNKFQFIPPDNFYESKFGSLGNSSDGAKIMDARGALIDSVEYSGDWCGGRGRSIERISVSNNLNSCDSANWKTSLDPDGATPGILNSYGNVIEYKNSQLIINEIMYEPGGENSEFIEFYNKSGNDIQLGGISLDINDDKIINLTDCLTILPVDMYFVLAKDSALINFYSIPAAEKILSVNNSLSLPNENAVLVLKDYKGNVLDSLEYNSDWHNKNFLQTRDKSLERISPNFNSCAEENWSTSVAAEGATPLRRNSVFTANVNLVSGLDVNPNPFSPDDDGYEDFTVIGIKLDKPLSQLRAKIFDSMGRLVRTLERNLSSAANASIIFDGLDDNGKALRIGIYILLVETFSADGAKNVFKKAIVIARKL